MSDFELALITNRHLCPEPLPLRVEKVLKAGVSYVIVREKDMTPEELRPLVGELAGLCDRHRARLIVNSRLEAARDAGAWGLQLPFDQFKAQRKSEFLRGFKVGVSIHNLSEAEIAAESGVDWLLAGHIFDTGCKAGLPGRGLDFLRLLRQVKVPLWAIGGLTPDKARPSAEAGAEVICVMSALLQSPEPERLVRSYLAAGR